MTSATLEPRPPRSPPPLQRRRFGDISRATWDRLFGATLHATPFSRWTFHRAWWDAYGETAEDQYLVLEGAEQGPITEELPGRGTAPRSEADTSVSAIVPLMARPVPDEGRVLFMGASYHADYAAILAAPDDLPSTVASLAATLVAPSTGTLAGGLDAIDLRRLRAVDPTSALLAQALESVVERPWQVKRRQEDVCPVLALAPDWESQLAAMSRVARHELRRKLRRADRVGAVRLRRLPLEPATVARFIDLHQARWGAAGLFADTVEGERSRRFFYRLTELEAAEGPDAQLLFAEVSVGDRAISAAVAFDDGTTCYFYNAAMDPQARDLSPGVIGTAMLIRDRAAAGRQRFDFLRGDEAYKYEWGAVDEPIEQVTVRRSGD